MRWATLLFLFSRITLCNMNLLFFIIIAFSYVKCLVERFLSVCMSLMLFDLCKFSLPLGTGNTWWSLHLPVYPRPTFLLVRKYLDSPVSTSEPCNSHFLLELTRNLDFNPHYWPDMPNLAWLKLPHWRIPRLILSSMVFYYSITRNFG